MIRILLVEDDAVNRDVLTRYLTLMGYDIVIAVNGGQAAMRTKASRQTCRI